MRYFFNFKIVIFFFPEDAKYFQKLNNVKGLMTGYGVTDDWISEYEKFIDRKLKRFSLKVLYLL